MKLRTILERAGFVKPKQGPLSERGRELRQELDTQGFRSVIVKETKDGGFDFAGRSLRDELLAIVALARAGLIPIYPKHEVANDQ